jgi:hypothetical protein
LARAEADLTALIERLKQAGDSTMMHGAQDQLAAIQGLRQQVATAGLLTLISLSSNVSASVASTATVVAQGQAVADRAVAAAELAKADAEARQSVAGFMDDYYKKRIFDPWLRFASKDDEEAFRQRERERQEAIARAQAKHTPEGDLEANRLSIEQLKDAGAHGADQSPVYGHMMRGLTASKDQLSAAIEAPKQKASAERLDAAGDGGDVQKAAAAVDPAVLAAFASVASPEQGPDGHGLTTKIAKSDEPLPVRGQS